MGGMSAPPQQPSSASPTSSQRALQAPPTLLGLPRSEATYALFLGLFVVTLVLTNVVGTKLFTGS